MPARGMPGSDSRELKRHNLAIEKGNDPTHWAHETLWLARAPIHVLRPIDGSDFFRKTFSQYLGSSPPFFCDCSGKVFALRSRDLLKFAHVDPSLFSERFRCGSGLAVLKGYLEGWACNLFG